MIFDIDNDSDIRYKVGDVIEGNAYIKSIHERILEVGANDPRQRIPIDTVEKYNIIAEGFILNKFVFSNKSTMHVRGDMDFEGNTCVFEDNLDIFFESAANLKNINIISHRHLGLIVDHLITWTNVNLVAESVLMYDLPCFELPRRINSNLTCEGLGMIMDHKSTDPYLRILQEIHQRGTTLRDMYPHQVVPTKEDAKEILQKLNITPEICNTLVIGVTPTKPYHQSELQIHIDMKELR